MSTAFLVTYLWSQALLLGCYSVQALLPPEGIPAYRYLTWVRLALGILVWCASKGKGKGRWRITKDFRAALETFAQLLLDRAAMLKGTDNAKKQEEPSIGQEGFREMNLHVLEYALRELIMIGLV